MYRTRWIIEEASLRITFNLEKAGSFEDRAGRRVGPCVTWILITLGQRGGTRANNVSRQFGIRVCIVYDHITTTTIYRGIASIANSCAWPTCTVLRVGVLGCPNISCQIQQEDDGDQSLKDQQIVLEADSVIQHP